MDRFFSAKQQKTLSKKRKLDELDPEIRKKQKEEFERKKAEEEERKKIEEEIKKKKESPKINRVLTEEQKRLTLQEKEMIDKILKEEEEVVKRLIRKQQEKQEEKWKLEKAMMGDKKDMELDECLPNTDREEYKRWDLKGKCNFFMKRSDISIVNFDFTTCFCRENPKNPERNKYSWWTIPVLNEYKNELVPKPEYDANFKKKYTFYALCGGTKAVYIGKNMELVLDTPFIPLRKIGLKKWFDDKEKGCYSFANNYGSLGSLQKIEKEIEEKKRIADRKKLKILFSEWMERIEILFEYERGYFTENQDDLDEEGHQFFKEKIRAYVEKGELVRCLLQHPSELSEEEKQEIQEDYNWWFLNISSFAEKLQQLDKQPSLRKFISFDQNSNIRLDIHGFYKLLKKDIENKLYNKNNFY